MLTRRNVCLWLAALVFMVLALCPPWVATLGRMGEDFPSRSQRLWHSPLWRPPQWSGRWTVEPDYRRLVLELAASEALIAAAYLTSRAR